MPKSCIQNRNGFSDFYECNIGFQQGKNISPLLFSIFLNDLAEFMSANSKGIQLEFNTNILDCFISLYVLLYADDTILIRESPKDPQFT